MKSSERTDVEGAILNAQRIPCICDRQHEDSPPLGRPVARGRAPDMTIERIQCDGCSRKWRRIIVGGPPRDARS